jgi:hypothetical protein
MITGRVFVAPIRFLIAPDGRRPVTDQGFIKVLGALPGEGWFFTHAATVTVKQKSQINHH